MSHERNHHPQHFILRLWPEILADGSVEWRGKLHHVQANEVRYFRDWPALIPTLLAMLRQADLPFSTLDLSPLDGLSSDPEPKPDPSAR